MAANQALATPFLLPVTEKNRGEEKAANTHKPVIHIQDMAKRIECLGVSTINSLADVFRLLGEPNRLRILCCLGNEVKSVSEIQGETGIEQSNASFHLRFLRKAALVRAERRGRNMYYWVQDKELLGLLTNLSHWMNRALPNNVKADAEMRSKSLRKKKKTDTSGI